VSRVTTEEFPFYLGVGMAAVLDEYQNIVASEQANKGLLTDVLRWLPSEWLDDMMFTVEQISWKPRHEARAPK
jgi:hypothetical protein